jgi:hypothetical protein
MEIKGVAVKSIPDYIKKEHPEKYSEWMSLLPHDSKKIFLDGIISSQWYPIENAAITPTQKMGELLFNDPKKGAWESGKYSAEAALTGIYKIYVKLSSPTHIINRASRIFQAYYKPAEISTSNARSNSVEVHITKFSKPDEVIEYRIGGWIQRALELSGCHDVEVVIDKSLTNGDSETHYSIKWG